MSGGGGGGGGGDSGIQPPPIPGLDDLQIPRPPNNQGGSGSQGAGSGENTSPLSEIIQGLQQQVDAENNNSSNDAFRVRCTS